MITSVFDRSGMAAVSDFASREWMQYFEKLEAVQREFLAAENVFRSPLYRWPRDPLHTWSRPWEYVYTYHHIARNERSGSTALKVVDFGSGVTFFPFALARLGCDVTCVDVDPVCGPDLERASNCIEHRPGAVRFSLIGSGRMPVETGTVDVLCCVSVLEHIAGFEGVVADIARVLKPGATCILTIDIDLRGDSEIGVAGFARLRACILEHFRFKFAETVSHPLEVLTSQNSPYADRAIQGLDRVLFEGQNLLRRVLWRRPRKRIPYVLAVEGLVLEKK